MSEKLGGVVVEVRASTGQLDAGFANAKTKTTNFDRTVTTAMKSVADSAKKMADSVSQAMTRAATSEDAFSKAIAEQTRVLQGIEGAIQKMVGAKATAATAADRATASEVKQTTATKEMGQAATRVVGSVNSLTSAQKALDVVAGTTAAKLSGVEAAALSAGNAAEKAGAQAAGASNSWMKAGSSSENFAAKLRSQLYGNKGGSGGGTAEGVREVGAAAKLSAQEMKMLAIQIPDVVQGILGGQRAFQIFVQQGGQMVQVLGMQRGMAGAFRALGSLISPQIILFTGLAAAIGLTTKAAYDHVQAEDKLRVSLRGTGLSTGLSVGQLEKQARSSVVNTNISMGAARDFQAQLLKTGQIGGQVFEGLGSVQKKYALATQQNLQDAGTELTQSFANPSQGADTFAKKLQAVDGQTKRHIESLVAQNRTYDAQVLLLKALQDRLSHAATEGDDLSMTFDRIKGTASLAADAIGRFFSAPSANELKAKLQEPQRILDQMQANLNRNTSAAEELATKITPSDRKRELQEQTNVLFSGQISAGLKGQTQDVQRYGEALDRTSQALKSYLTPAQQAHQLAELDAKAARTHDPKGLADIAAQRTRIQSSGQLTTATEQAQAAQDSFNVSLAQSRDALSQEARAMNADTAGALALASAYLQGDAAAIRATASRAAAIRASRGDISFSTAYARELAASVAAQAQSGGQLVAQTRNQASAQADANELVLQGIKSSAEANREVSQAVTLKGLEAAADVASGDAKKKLLEIIKELKKAYGELNTESDKSAVNAQIEQQGDEGAVLRRQIELVRTNASSRTTDAALAKLQAEQKIEHLKLTGSQEGNLYVAGEVGNANQKNTLGSETAVRDFRRDIAAQNAELQAQAAAYSMTNAQAASYQREQQILIDATRTGTELTDEQRAAIHQLAKGYGEAAAAADELARRQRAAADAANFLADEASDAFIDVVTGAKKSSEAIKDVAKDLLKAQLRAALRGDGPLAGVFGTNKQSGPNQPNGGVLSQVFGKLFGVGKPQTPAGTSADPVFVKSVDPATGATGSVPDIVAKQIGLDPNDPQRGRMFGDGYNAADGTFNLSGGSSGGGGSPFDFGTSGLDLNAFGAGDQGFGADFLSGLDNVFKQNTDGGFLGGLKGIFSGLFSGGGGGGGGGGLMGMLGGLFGGGKGGGGGGGLGGSLGSIAGSLAAKIALSHNGLQPGAVASGHSRLVDPRIFLSAPRFHDGLAPDEFPSILQRGERVQSKAEVASERRPPQVVNINVSGVTDVASFNRSDRQVGSAYRRRFGT